MIDYTDANILYRVYRGNSNFEVQLSINFNAVCQGKSFVIDYNPYNLPLSPIRTKWRNSSILNHPLNFMQFIHPAPGQGIFEAPFYAS